MIDALIAGRIHGTPTQKDGRNGPFAVATVRVTVRDGEAYFVNVIAFAEPVVAALLCLAAGDSVALTGELTPKARLDRDNKPRAVLDLLAHAALTTYQVTRKRQATRSDEPVSP